VGRRMRRFACSDQPAKQATDDTDSALIVDRWPSLRAAQKQSSRAPSSARRKDSAPTLPTVQQPIDRRKRSR